MQINSVKTSVNTTRLPAIYNKINWNSYANKNKKLFDYGCGRSETRHLVKKLLDEFGIEYIPYDLYNMDSDEAERNLARIKETDIVICSNVLNVISDNLILIQLMQSLDTLTYKDKQRDVYIKVYEGDGSGEEKKTSKGYQRNLKTSMYKSMLYALSDSSERWNIKNKIITNNINGVK